MTRFQFLALTVSLMFIIVVPLSQAQDGPMPTPKEDLAALVQGNNQFAFDLYGRLRKKPGNLIFSPYSISNALTLAYAGARGETAREMAKTLHFSLPVERHHRAFGDLLTRSQKPDKPGNYQLQVANALWGQEGYPVLAEFQNLLEERYKAPLRPVDFAGAPDVARQTINKWFEAQTNNLIRDLLGEKSVNIRTRLVLTNTIYFKADWKFPFKKEDTRDQFFKISPEEQVKAPLMYQTGFFPYYDLNDAQLVELPYQGGNNRWWFCCRAKLMAYQN